MVLRDVVRWTCVVLLLSCAGGELDEDNFSERAAGPACKQMKRCLRGYYESEYKDMDDCIDEVMEDYDDYADLADDWGCDFDESGAEDCLDFLRSADCESFYEDFFSEYDGSDCADVWDCD